MPHLAVDELAADRCTLAQIEREFAKRIGPYAEYTVRDNTSVDNLVSVGRIRSSIDAGGFEDLFLLRRGFDSNGDPIGGFDDDDRQRVITNFHHDDGLLEVDRDYTNPPQDGEVIEVHYLDPEFELRPVVMNGLMSKARIVSSETISLLTVNAQQNMTELLPQITRKGQIYEIESSYPGEIYAPIPVPFWNDFQGSDGDLWVVLDPVPFPQQVRVHHWRYAGTLVNGLYSFVGPTLDTDVMYVNVSYAAAAAHERAWNTGQVRPRIFEAARKGHYLSNAQTVADFENIARANFKPRQRRMMPVRPMFAGQQNLVINASTP